MNQSGRVPVRRAVGCVALTACALGAACDRRLDFPLVRYDVRLEADAVNVDKCDGTVDVAFDPVHVAPQVEGNLYQMTAFTYTAALVGKPVEDGPRNYECWYDYRSPALSPGTWKITGEFPDGSKSCLRDVGGGQSPTGVAIDQQQGCVEPGKSGANGELGGS